MAAGKINLQANDGAVIGLVVPDGLTSGERQISLGSNTGSLVPYHLLQGNLAVSNSTITQGMNTTLYTSGSATTNIDMDTQWGSTAEEKFGGLIWLKDRVEATSNFLYDTIRGATKEINSNTTDAEATLAGGLTAFNSTGFTVGADTGHNSTTNNMVSWNFQTTHRITGTTNHGKAYTCHYNPFTGFTTVKYEGSGIAGHEIPHMLGRELSINMIKNLTAVTNWRVQKSDNITALLNTTDAWTGSGYVSSNNTSNIVLTSATDVNASTQLHIMYGWANSYFDESSKLIGNYEIGMYQGTGASGNKVLTRGKPAWVMIKRVDSTGNWVITDNKRLSPAGILYPNLTTGETGDIANFVYLESDGLNIKAGNADTNALGGQYIALVAYDTNANGGGSYYPLASDTANVQVNNALIPLAKGIDANGVKNSVVVANETITGVTYTAGKNYLYKTDSSYGVKSYNPRYLKSELVRRFAGEQPDYYDVESNKWFNCDAGTELNSNKAIQTNDTGSWVVSSNGTLSWVQGRYTMARSVINSNVTFTRTFTGLTAGITYNFALTITRTGNDWYVSLDGGTTIYATITDGLCNISITPTTTSVAFTIMQSNVNTVGISLYVTSISVYKASIVPTTEITESRNYMNHIVHADNDGGVLYVEELPKIEYKDIVKANEFQGKNACTASVNFDGTTTPPTIRDSYNVSAVIRTATGLYDIYFKEAMDNVSYVMSGSGTSNTYSTIADPSVRIPMSTSNGQQLTKCTIMTKFVSNGGTGSENWNEVKLYFQGGKN